MQTFGGISLQPSIIARRVASAFVGATLAVTAFAAAPAYADNTADTSVAGAVTLDGKPKAGLKVCVGGAIYGDQGYVDYDTCTTTDADGRYSLSLYFPGTTDMAALWVDPGTEYQDVFRMTRLGEYRPGEGGYFRLSQGDHFTGLDLAVTSYPVVRGRVVDQTGAPIAGASVRSLVKTVATDANGRFEVPAMAFYDGGYIWIEAAGFSTSVLSLDSSGKPTTKTTVVLAKPVAVGEATISGVLKAHKKLTASVDVTGATKVKFSYRWYRDGSKIAKATKKSYRLTHRDRGKQITVRVTVRVKGQDPVVVTSAPTAPVAA